MRTITANHGPRATAEVRVPPSGASVQTALVVVQRAWSEWRTALVRLGDLEDVHWFRPAGAIRPLIHAYVWCDTIVSGRLSHDCNRSPCPHRVLVCLLKSHTSGNVFDELAHRANTAETQRAV
ncbi:MAG: hypothetical protein ACJ731_12390 [Vicinamibacterales bacterium]